MRPFACARHTYIVGRRCLRVQHFPLKHPPYTLICARCLLSFLPPLSRALLHDRSEYAGDQAIVTVRFGSLKARTAFEGTEVTVTDSDGVVHSSKATAVGATESGDTIFFWLGPWPITLWPLVGMIVIAVFIILMITVIACWCCHFRSSSDSRGYDLSKVNAQEK